MVDIRNRDIVLILVLLTKKKKKNERIDWSSYLFLGSLFILITNKTIKTKYDTILSGD